MAVSRAEIKTERTLKALHHEVPDRMPKTDAFWRLFVEKWKKEKNTDDDIYEYYDMDMVIQFPNIEPIISHKEIIEKTGEYEIYRTGFGYKIKQKYDCVMPQYLEPMLKSGDDYEKFVFDDPEDNRRFYEFRDDLINLGDWNLASDSYIESVEKYGKNFCVFGGTCDPFEYIWRMRGTEGLLLDLALCPEKVERFIERVTDFNIKNCLKQIKTGKVKGFFMAGDVAYDKGMFFSPELWTRIFQLHVKRMIDAIHAHGAVVIYHSCGNPSAVVSDLIECGIDCLHPLEVKAGLDVVSFKRRYKNRLGYYGGIDVRILENGTSDEVRNEVMRKLNAAKNGGYIMASDHSVTGNAKVENYEYMVELINSYGTYPINLGEYDEEI